MENQLKETELRINNLIYDVNNNLCCVSNLRKDLIIAKYLGIGSALGGVEDFKGVPLSEDILLRLGFEIDSVDRPILHADLKIINPVTKDFMMELKNVGDGWFYRNGYFKIDYVHQLQNLYHSLTGEELTFKN